MKIVICSYWYPISISRYFEKALRHMDGVELVTVGPTSGAFIPWGDNFHYPDHAFTPDFETTGRPEIAGLEVANYIEQGKIKDVDLWLTVDAGFYPDTPMPWPHFIVATDPHCLNYDRQRELVDKFFCMQKVYSKPGDIYLPYCYSEFDHYPEDGPAKYDVTILGLQYMSRMMMAEHLKDGGVNAYAKLGHIWDDYRQVICSAPICFTWSSKQDLIARVFEGLAMGRLVITNRVPDLGLFFEEGEHLLAYSGDDEAIAHVEWCLDNPVSAQTIAKAGRQVVKEHTYTNRLGEVLEYLSIV